jgi:hypothetical protein
MNISGFRVRSQLTLLAPRNDRLSVTALLRRLGRKFYPNTATFCRLAMIGRPLAFHSVIAWLE